jgi:HD superfamily phosphodiesterase
MESSVFDNLREFVKPYCADKGDLENLSHVQRLLSSARDLAEGEKANDDLLVFGAHLHDMIFHLEERIRDFLFSLGLDRTLVIEIMKVAWESGKEAKPETQEGNLLRDAHLIEGGKEYQMAKWLSSGAGAGQTLLQSLEFLEARVIGRYKCSVPKAQRIYEEIEAYRRQFVDVVRKALKSGSPGAADSSVAR